MATFIATINELIGLTFSYRRDEPKIFCEENDCSDGRLGCDPVCPIQRSSNNFRGKYYINCTCVAGYIITNDPKVCRPDRNERYWNCTVNELVNCAPGYETMEVSCLDKCSPHCGPKGCIDIVSCQYYNYVCFPSRILECLNAFSGEDCIKSKTMMKVCIPTCDETCINGECRAPNYCQCNNHEYTKAEWFRCEPNCPDGCIGGNCTFPSWCTCDSDKIQISKNKCENFNNSEFHVITTIAVVPESLNSEFEFLLPSEEEELGFEWPVAFPYFYAENIDCDDIKIREEPTAYSCYISSPGPGKTIVTCDLRKKIQSSYNRTYWFYTTPNLELKLIFKPVNNHSVKAGCSFHLCGVSKRNPFEYSVVELCKAKSISGIGVYVKSLCFSVVAALVIVSIIMLWNHLKQLFRNYIKFQF